MPLDRRLALLQKIYALFDEFCSGLDLACGKGCSLCCTTNVTMTTLEGLLISGHYQAMGRSLPLEKLCMAAQNPRFQPTLTLNHLAALCAQGQEIPDEAADPNVGPCPLLEENCCTIYAARPFGCRAMVSRGNCRANGAADMPDELLSANNLLLQSIEALDSQGLSGNLIDILLLLSNPHQCLAIEEGRYLDPTPTLATNRSIPVLMIAPEHRQRLRPLMQAVRKLLQEPNKGGNGH